MNSQLVIRITIAKNDLKPAQKDTQQKKAVSWNFATSWNLVHPRTCWLFRHHKKNLLDLQFFGFSEKYKFVFVLQKQRIKSRKSFYFRMNRIAKRSISSMHGRERFAEVGERDLTPPLAALSPALQQIS